MKKHKTLTYRPSSKRCDEIWLTMREQIFIDREADARWFNFYNRSIAEPTFSRINNKMKFIGDVE